MLWQHLAISSLQSLTASVQNGLHILEEIQPHVLRHPKISVPQSSARCFTEVIHPTWKQLNLMLLRNSNTLQQSSNMLSPGTFTTGPIIHPQPLKHPKTFRQLSVMLTPKWSTWPDKPPTSCLSGISRCLGAIFDHDCTKWVAHSGRHLTSCVGVSEDARPTLFSLMCTEVLIGTWQNINLMRQSTRNARLQS